MFFRKINSIFAFAFLVLIASSVGSIFTAGSLSFYLNGDKQIESYNAFGDMGYFVGPNEFVGQDITTILPLSDEVQAIICAGFEQARKEDKVVTVTYDFKGINYTVEITPLKCEMSDSFFVKVWETK